VWVEKVKAKGSGNPITAINIHTRKYDREELKTAFYNGYPRTSDTAWGIFKNSNKTGALVYSDKSGKYLNITPSAVAELTSKNDKPIHIPLGVELENNEISPEELVSTEVLKVLDSLSKKLFGK